MPEHFQTDGGASSTYFMHSRPEMLNRVPRSACRLLEFGCGAGSFGSALKRRQDCEFWGVEVNSEAADIAGKVLDRIIVGDAYLSIERLPTDYFDCLIFNDVLEHLVDPWRVLAESRRCLKANGVVVGSIPNLLYAGSLKELLLHKDWRYEDEGVRDRTHLRFFTRRGVERLLIGAGYDGIQVAGINELSFVKSLAVTAISLGYLAEARFLQWAFTAVSPKSCSGRL